MNVAPQRRHYLIFALVFIGLAIYGSLVPLQYTPLDFEAALERFRELPYLRLGIQSRSDWVANVLLFIPIGFLLAAACLVDRPGLTRKLVLSPLLLAGCGTLSVAIEFTQLWFPPRTVSQNDIIAESLGALIGITVWLSAGARVTRSIRSYLTMSRPADQLEWLLRAYLVGFLVYSVLPFDVTIRPAELWDKYKQGNIFLVPFSYGYESTYRAIYSLVATLVMFVPAGMLIGSHRPTSSLARPLMQNILLGFVLAAGIEGAQLFVYSRVTNSADVIVGTLGAAIGVWLIRRWRTAEPSLSTQTQAPFAPLAFAGLAVLYAAALPFAFWAPYDFITDIELIRARLNGLWRIPFSAMYVGTDFNAMVQITRKTLWYVPLGALLAAAANTAAGSMAVRRILPAAALIAVFSTAVFIEVGKSLVPSRTPDFTNVILAGFGGALGILLARRFVSTPQWRPTRREPQVLDRTQPPPLYVPGLDGLRALACLAVFGVHLQQLTGISGTVGPFQISRFLENGNHGVALFFIVSGFLLALPWVEIPPVAGRGWLSSYGVKRIARIAPAYLLCLTFLVVKGRHWQTSLERVDTLLHYVFLHNVAEFSIYSLSSPFWTLAVQAQFYLLFPLLLLFVHRVARHKNARLHIWLALAGGAFVLHYGVMVFSNRMTSWPLSDVWVAQNGFVLTHSLLSHLPLFLLGVAASHGFWALRRRPVHVTRLPCEIAFWSSAIITLAVLGTPLDEVAQIPFARYHFPLVPGLLAVAVITVAYTRWAQALLESRPLRLLGVISFGVYVYHLPGLNVVSRAMTILGVDPAKNWLVFGVLGLVCSISVAAVSYVAIERPLLRMAKGRRDSVTRAAERTASAQFAATS